MARDLYSIFLFKIIIIILELCSFSEVVLASFYSEKILNQHNKSFAVKHLLKISVFILSSTFSLFNLVLNFPSLYPRI